jgi:prepilin peptidase CpaA
MALALAILGAAAAIEDVRARRVPDVVSLALAATGVLAALLDGRALASVAGAAIGLALLLPLFAARWVGGGDVKLLAGLGAWVGPHAVIGTALGGLVGGGVLAAAMSVAAGPRWRAITVPLAVPLVAAALIARAVAP